VETSIFAFATDLADEGIETVLDNVQERGGLGGLTVAAAYHEGRDVFPHNPRHKVRFLESGAVFFPPDPARWRGVRLLPPVSDVADALPRTIEAAGRRGLAVRAWTVFLHNGALAAAHPDCAPENAFGDRYVTDLCPANPEVRAFARALAADVARLGVAAICSESLHYHALEHGYAHERYFVPLGLRARYLLGLCFCRHCLEAARVSGIDGEAVRRFAREELERVFGGGSEEPVEELDPDELGTLADGELAGYARARADTVGSLVAEVAEAARGDGAEFEFIDLSGALKGYATGRPVGRPAPSIAWQLGVDVAAVARASDGIEAIGYAADPKRLSLDLKAYGEAAVSVVLRPTPPDCDSPGNLRAKVELAGELGLRRVDFYHYGFMRLDALDWIRAALRV
jgi:hydrogenase/urease accessory protein HupE